MSNPESTNEETTYPDPQTLEIRRRLPGPIQRVWDYLVQDSLRKQWICGGQVADQVGGEIEFDFDHRRLSDREPPAQHQGGSTAQFVGRILVYQPPVHLAFTWPSPENLPDTEVDIRLSEQDGWVDLVLRHTRITSSSDRTSASAGWHTHLDRLRDLLDGRPPRDFWEHYQQLEDHYQSRVS